jgi:hypothetical protein
MVYGPMVEADKPAFLDALGDFNMIYHAQNKSNDGLDCRRMGQFRQFLNVTALKEIHLQGMLFTWSNERVHPMLERIDNVFVLVKCDCLFPHHDLGCLPSLCSDLVSLLLRTEANLRPK